VVPDDRSEVARVLLVEDDDDIRIDLAELLEHEGFAVTCAAHGRDALSALHRRPRPHVILLDLMMPEMDGWAFRSRQLADESLAAIPVLLLTASGHDSVDELKPAGCVTKPIDLDRLCFELRRLASGQNHTPVSARDSDA
jgi:CheY-like chemotaxis protein